MQLLIPSICLLVILIHPGASSLPSNPFDYPSRCGLSEPGYVCDPSNQIGASNRQKLSERLSSFNLNNVCGQCVAISVQASVATRPGQKIEQACRSLAADLANGDDWSFDSCKRLSVIVVSVDPKYVFFQAGDGAQLCSQTSKIFGQAKSRFVHGIYHGLLAMLQEYEGQFLNTYRGLEDCEKQTCGLPGRKEKSYAVMKAKNLQKLLPSPRAESKYCNVGNSGLLCDPHRVLTATHRGNVVDQLNILQANNANNCKQCLAIALLDKTTEGRVKVADTKIIVRDILRGHWQLSECKGLALIAINVPERFVWLQGNEHTVACSKMKTIYSENVKRFDTEGGIYEGLMGMINSYQEILAKDYTRLDTCQTDICKKSGSSAKGAPGGLSSGIGGYAIKFAKEHIGLIVGLVVGCLVLLFCLLGCGFICCKEKTMGALRSVGQVATTRGPALAGRLFKGRGKGGIGGNAMYVPAPAKDGMYNDDGVGGGGDGGGGVGGTWGGDTYTDDHDYAANGGGGGTWGDDAGKGADSGGYQPVPAAPSEPSAPAPSAPSKPSKPAEGGGGGSW